MTEPRTRDERFLDEVRRQADLAGRSRENTLWRGLSMVGTVGWMVSVPAVLGAAAGRWLDARFGTGIFWTLSLLTAGLALGCASAWRHVRKELDL